MHCNGLVDYTDERGILGVELGNKTYNKLEMKEYYKNMILQR